MKADTLKLAFTYLIAIFVLAAGFYSLVIFPYQLDDLVKGAIISFMTLALNSVFSDQVAARTGASSQKAFDAGLVATPPTTTTVSAGPPVTVTTTPNGDPDAPWTDPQG